MHLWMKCHKPRCRPIRRVLVWGKPFLTAMQQICTTLLDARNLPECSGLGTRYHRNLWSYFAEEEEVLLGKQSGMLGSYIYLLRFLLLLKKSYLENLNA